MLALYMTFIDDENDKEKFEKIYYAHRRQMAALALSIVHSETDAEDIVHEVFLTVATKHMPTINRIANETDIRNYLLKATKNTSLNWQNKNKRILYVENNEVYEKSDMELDELEKYLCQRMEYERVLEAIKCLEPRYRDVLYHHYVMETPVPQIAKTFHQSVSATKKQLVRGKKKLLQLLEGE